MEILAIIPARGESKRIPEKNIRTFHGKPLIAWTIEAARKSKLITRIFVNTDNKKIASIAKQHGAEIPFLRPRKLAIDSMGIEPVLVHAFEWLKTNENYEPQAIILLMPTNPLKLPQHLDQMITTFKNKKVDSLVTVSEALGNNNPHWILKKNPAGKITFFNDTGLKKIITRSQDLPICYSRNDIAYILKPRNLYQKPTNLYGDRVELFVMDEFFNGDINTQEDWNIALDKFRRLKKMIRKI